MLAVLFALALAADCPKGADGRIPETHPPSWDKKPTAEDIQWSFPRAAGDRGITGEVLLSCVVAANGRPEACTVKQETPRGEGFGEAAIAATSRMSFIPAKKCGAYSRERVVIPVNYQAWNPPPEALPVTPEKLAFAERLVKAEREMEISPRFRYGLTDMNSYDPQRRAMAADVFDEIYPAYEAKIDDLRKQALAAMMTEGQLREAVAFFESETGRLLMSGASRKTLEDLGALERELREAYNKALDIKKAEAAISPAF